MMSRWFALRRTSSSNGKSHSKRTSKICISRKTLVTLSNPMIQPMYRSSIASRNGRLSRRLSILSADRMAILLLSLNASVPIKNQVVSQILHSRTSRPVVGVLTCPNTSLVSPGPTPNCNLPILPVSLYLSPGKLSESSLVQTPYLCLQDLLPTSACRGILNAHLQASCRSSHLSKHLTCVSRTYSQPQPVEIFQACQNMSLQAIN